MPRCSRFETRAPRFGGGSHVGGACQGAVHERAQYVVGGASPLVLLPRKTWVLVESVGDEVLVEAGAFAGADGLGFSRFFDAEEERAPSPRWTRRDEGPGARWRGGTSGGRFASAFFVEETEMTKAELDDELEEGEGEAVGRV